MGIWHLLHGNKRPITNGGQGAKAARGEQGEETRTEGEEAHAYPHERGKQAWFGFCCRGARMTGKVLRAPGTLLRNSPLQETSASP